VDYAARPLGTRKMDIPPGLNTIYKEVYVWRRLEEAAAPPGSKGL